jgi:hypothetical protein
LFPYASSLIGTLRFCGVAGSDSPLLTSLNEPISVRLLSGGKLVLAYRALNKNDVKVKIFDADFKYSRPVGHAVLDETHCEAEQTG